MAGASFVVAALVVTLSEAARPPNCITWRLDACAEWTPYSSLAILAALVMLVGVLVAGADAASASGQPMARRAALALAVFGLGGSLVWVVIVSGHWQEFQGEALTLVVVFAVATAALAVRPSSAPVLGALAAVLVLAGAAYAAAGPPHGTFAQGPAPQPQPVPMPQSSTGGGPGAPVSPAASR